MNSFESHESSEQPFLDTEAWLETWLADGGDLSRVVEDFDEGLLTGLNLDELVLFIDAYEEKLSEEEALLLSDLSDFLDTTKDSTESTWLDSALKQRLDSLDSPDWNSFDEMKAACGKEEEFVIELENLPPDVWGRFNEETRVFLRQKIQNIVLLDFSNDLDESFSLAPNTRGLSFGEGMVAINSGSYVLENPNQFISTLLHEATHESGEKEEHSLSEEIRAYKGQLYYLNSVEGIPDEITDSVERSISRGEFIQKYFVEKFPELNHLHPADLIYAHELVEHDIDLSELKKHLESLNLEAGNEFFDEFETAIDAANIFLNVLADYPDVTSQYEIFEYYLFPEFIELHHFTENEFYFDMAEQFAGLIHHHFPEKNKVSPSEHETIYDGFPYLESRSAYIFNPNLERSALIESLAAVNSVQDLIALPDDHPAIVVMTRFSSASQSGEKSYFFDDLIHLSHYVMAYRKFNEYSEESLIQLVHLLEDTYLKNRGPLDLEGSILYLRTLDLLYEWHPGAIGARYENLNRNIAMDPAYNAIYTSLVANPKSYRPQRIPKFVSTAFEELKSWE